MKILLLADPSNPHTIKWVNSLSDKGIEIFLFGLSRYDKFDYPKSIKIKTLKTPAIIKSKLSGNLFKSMYFFILPKLRRTIKEFNPDILHAHYAGSYGVIGALTNFHPFILSVWGVDINIFPNVSFFHNHLIKYALNNADFLLATSQVLKQETLKYVSKNIDVIPFGIDLNIFRPKKIDSLFSKDDIVVGTIKRLEEKYGIDQLIKAFTQVTSKHPELSIKLLLVGDGSIKSKLVKLVNELKINEITIFAGSVPHEKVIDYHNMIDIAVFLSKTESFGVSVLEAAACGKPVIVNNVGGLPEIVEDGVTGLIVPYGDLEKAAGEIERLVLNPELRKKMGEAGRDKVRKEYNWNDNLHQMIVIYNRILKSYANPEDK